MTPRERINKRIRRRWIGFLASPVVVLFVMLVGAFLEANYSVPHATLGGLCVGLALLMTIMFLGVWQWPCPCCKKNVLPYLGCGGGLRDDIFKMSPAFRFCPYCGCNFDLEIEWQNVS